MALSDTFTRISVQIPRCQVDFTVAKDLPVAVLVAEIRQYLADSFRDDEDHAEQLKYLDDPYAVWQLTDSLGVHYPSDQSMVDVGIRDGAIVVLANSSQRENYAPLIDDVAEAIAHYQRMHFGEWVNAHARALAGVVLGIAALLGVGAVVAEYANGALGEIGQYIAAVVLGFGAGALLIGATMAYRGIDDPDSDLHTVNAGVIVSGYLAAAGAGILVVPGGFGMLSITLGAVLAGAAALVVNAAIRFPETLNYATISVAVLVGAGTGIAQAIGASAFAAAFGIALGAMWLFLLTERISLKVARVPMPDIPAQGETFIRDDDEDLTRINPDSRNSVVAAIINQEAQVLTSHWAQLGIIWGAMATMVGSAFVGGSELRTHPVLGFAFFGVVVVAMLYRGKSFTDAVVCRSVMIGTFATAAAFLVAVTTTGRHVDLVVGAAAVVFAGAVAAAYVAARTPTISPITKKGLELIENLLYAAPVTLLIFLMGWWSAVRGR